MGNGTSHGLLALLRVWTKGIPGLVVALGMAVGLWVPPSYVHIVVILVCLTLQ